MRFGGDQPYEPPVPRGLAVVVEVRFEMARRVHVIETSDTDRASEMGFALGRLEFGEGPMSVMVIDSADLQKGYGER